MTTVVSTAPGPGRQAGREAVVPVRANAVMSIGAVRLAATTPLTAPVEQDVVVPDEDVSADSPWDVLVWDDPVNLMSYVVYVFRKIFGFEEPMARKLMLEVHQKGKALVATEPKEQAELYVQQLHAHGLQATMQRSR